MRPGDDASRVMTLRWRRRCAGDDAAGAAGDDAPLVTRRTPLVTSLRW